MLWYLQPAWNVTFLSDRSYLEKVPFLNRRTRGFTIGLSFQVPPATLHGLLFVEAHGTEVCQSGATIHQSVIKWYHYVSYNNQSSTQL